MKPVAFAAKALRYWKRNGRYWSFAKAANAALAKLSLRLGLRYVPARPIVAKIEATNACNGTCRLCPVGQKLPSGRKAGLIDFDLFRELVDKLKGTLVVLDVTNWGESLLHPQILDMIRHAHDARLYTYLSTNLHTVRQRHIDGLMTCGLDELTLSLHGLSPETYAAYQPGFDFATACDLIGRLADARRRLGREGKPKIQINFVVTAINEHEAPDVPDFAERHGVEYMLSEPSLNLRFAVDETLARARPDEARRIVRQSIDAWLGGDGYSRPLYRKLLDDPALMHRGRKLVPCDWPWTKIVINCDGSLSICCGSYHADDDIGRYAGQSIGQLWNSRAYRLCRSAFRKGARPGVNGDRVLCDHCPGVLL